MEEKKKKTKYEIMKLEFFSKNEITIQYAPT